MINIKKFTSTFLLTVLVLMTFLTPTYASEADINKGHSEKPTIGIESSNATYGQNSKQTRSITGFSSWDATISMNGTSIGASGATVFGKGVARYVGFDFLQVEEWNGYTWTILANSGPRYVQNSISYSTGYSVTGTKGKYYRVSAGHFAQGQDGNQYYVSSVTNYVQMK